MFGRFGIPSTARMSLAMYNTRADIDALVGALEKATAGARPKPQSNEQVNYPSPAAPSPAERGWPLSATVPRSTCSQA